jgi:hypothetical protein
MRWNLLVFKPQGSNVPAPDDRWGIAGLVVWETALETRSIRREICRSPSVSFCRRSSTDRPANLWVLVSEGPGCDTGFKAMSQLRFELDTPNKLKILLVKFLSCFWDHLWRNRLDDNWNCFVKLLCKYGIKRTELIALTFLYLPLKLRYISLMTYRVIALLLSCTDGLFLTVG